MAFRPKSTWKPPNGCAALELFLSQVEKELFEGVPRVMRKHNLSRNEWQALRALQHDHSVIIKPADKGSCVVVWDREDYLMEGYTQLRDNNVYTSIIGFSEDTIRMLVQKSNNMFQKLYEEHSISRDELRYFLYDVKNACSLGRLYLFNHNGLVNDCEIILIDKTDPVEPAIREAYWIERLKTMYPLGLNIQSENA